MHVMNNVVSVISLALLVVRPCTLDVLTTSASINIERIIKLLVSHFYSRLSKFDVLRIRQWVLGLLRIRFLRKASF